MALSEILLCKLLNNSVNLSVLFLIRILVNFNRKKLPLKPIHSCKTICRFKCVRSQNKHSAAKLYGYKAGPDWGQNFHGALSLSRGGASARGRHKPHVTFLGAHRARARSALWPVRAWYKVEE
jgi:hypothetical protein